MCRPVEVLLPSFVLFTFVRNVELGGVCMFIGWQPFYSPSTSFSFCLKMFFNRRGSIPSSPGRTGSHPPPSCPWPPRS